MRFAGQHNHCLEGLRKHLILPSLPRLVRGHGEQLHCRETLSGYPNPRASIDTLIAKTTSHTSIRR
jgi:hypothetical protein